MDDDALDASEVSVRVENGDVVLMGTVTTRDQKRHAEDIAERVSGVRDVINQLRVSRGETTGGAAENVPGFGRVLAERRQRGAALIVGLVRGLAPAQRDRLLDEFGREYLTRAVRFTGGNLSRAARLAGIDRPSFYRLLERHGLRATKPGEQRA